MFYNFAEYLKTELPTERIYVNKREKLSTEDFIPDRNILIRETGGNTQPYTLYTNKTIQVICRDLAVPNARALAWEVYQLFSDNGTFGLLLPAVTVNSIIYPASQTGQISPIQEPFNLGTDAEGRTEFTTNYNIIYQRS